MGAAIDPESPYLEFGLPPDGVAWLALGLGLLLLVLVVFARRLCEQTMVYLLGRPTRVLIIALAAAAFLLSTGYIVFYLRGGPRIIDSTSYFLQARALSEGRFAFDVPWPTGSFRGRFLTGMAGEPRLSVIFPPGYPALLAIGFWLSEPLLMGPLLGFALVIVTFMLALRLFGDRRIALLAATCSALCASLRYHTADTMSHALSAVLLSGVLLGALSERRGHWAISGLLAGWLFATRPVTFAVALIAVLLRKKPGKHLLVFGLCLLPGFALMLAHQVAATGSPWIPTQLHYYARADGPPDCFRYGFGMGIGCLAEHGQYVRDVLPDGYGLLEALRVTARRLSVHVLDIANLELLVIPVVMAMVGQRKREHTRLAATVVLLLFVAYAPFYFDGSYPGAGARMFAEALPIEHAFLAFGLVRLNLARFAVPAMLLGFAVHASYSHRALAERDGGRPMFEASMLPSTEPALVLVDTDHGFNLGFDPAAVSALARSSSDAPASSHTPGLTVARRHNDAHDRLLWERLGRPSAFAYSFRPSEQVATPQLIALDLARVSPDVFEAEALWPPLTVNDGWVERVHTAVECTKAKRGVRFHPLGRAEEDGLFMTWSSEIAVLEANHYELVSDWIFTGGLEVELMLSSADARGLPKLHGSADARRILHARPRERIACAQSAAVRLFLEQGPHRIELRLSQPPRAGTGLVILDRIELRRAQPPG